MELDLKGVAFYLKAIVMNQSIMSSVALSIAFSCKNIYACMLLMNLCNGMSQYTYTRGGRVATFALQPLKKTPPWSDRGDLRCLLSKEVLAQARVN